VSYFSTDLESITFQDAVAGWREQATADVSTRAFPGGTYAISIGGRREMQRSVGMLLDSIDDYRTLLGMLAARGVLLIDDWDTTEINVVMKSCSPSSMLANGQVLARADFIVEPDSL
jgi:hypothetical protein